MDEWVTIRVAIKHCPVSEKVLRDAIKAGCLRCRMRSEAGNRPGSWSRPVKHVLLAEVQAWAATGKGRPGRLLGARVG